MFARVKKAFRGRAARKLGRNRLALAGLSVIAVYFIIGLYVFTADTLLTLGRRTGWFDLSRSPLVTALTLEKVEAVVGPLGQPGWLQPPRPEQRMQAAKNYLDEFRKALRVKDKERALEALRFGERRIGKSPDEIKAIYDDAKAQYDELNKSDDLDKDPSAAAAIGRLEQTIDAAFAPLSRVERPLERLPGLSGHRPSGPLHRRPGGLFDPCRDPDRPGRGRHIRRPRLGHRRRSRLFRGLGRWPGHVALLDAPERSRPGAPGRPGLHVHRERLRRHQQAVPLTDPRLHRHEPHVLDRSVPRGSRRDHEAQGARVRSGRHRHRILPWYILIRHILPNTIHLAFINFSLLFIAAIKFEVVLSFLGLGVKVGPSWGRMIQDSTQEVINGKFWQIGAATAFMFVLVLAFNIVSDALQDAFDPKAV
jgi:hypothetical protein